MADLYARKTGSITWKINLSYRYATGSVYCTVYVLFANCWNNRKKLCDYFATSFILGVFIHVYQAHNNCGECCINLSLIHLLNKIT